MSQHVSYVLEHGMNSWFFSKHPPWENPPSPPRAENLQ